MASGKPLRDHPDAAALGARALAALVTLDRFGTMHPSETEPAARQVLILGQFVTAAARVAAGAHAAQVSKYREHEAQLAGFAPLLKPLAADPRHPKVLALDGVNECLAAEQRLFARIPRLALDASPVAVLDACRALDAPPGTEGPFHVWPPGTDEKGGDLETSWMRAFVQVANAIEKARERMGARRRPVPRVADVADVAAYVRTVAAAAEADIDRHAIDLDAERTRLGELGSQALELYGQAQRLASRGGLLDSRLAEGDRPDLARWLDEINALKPLERLNVVEPSRLVTDVLRSVRASADAWDQFAEVASRRAAAQQDLRSRARTVRASLVDELRLAATRTLETLADPRAQNPTWFSEQCGGAVARAWNALCAAEGRSPDARLADIVNTPAYAGLFTAEDHALVGQASGVVASAHRRDTHFDAARRSALGPAMRVQDDARRRQAFDEALARAHAAHRAWCDFKLPDPIPNASAILAEVGQLEAAFTRARTAVTQQHDTLRRSDNPLWKELKPLVEALAGLEPPAVTARSLITRFASERRF